MLDRYARYVAGQQTEKDQEPKQDARGPLVALQTSVVSAGAKGANEVEHVRTNRHVAGIAGGVGAVDFTRSRAVQARAGSWFQSRLLAC